MLPVTTDGSIDLTAASGDGNASLEDAVPRSMDSKATASLLDMEHIEKLSRGDVITDAGPQRPVPLKRTKHDQTTILRPEISRQRALCSLAPRVSASSGRVRL